MSNNGIKVSLPGFDVKTATPEQCAIHSGYNNLKVQSVSDDDSPVGYNPASDPGYGTHNILTVEHGLPYTPGCLGFIKMSPVADSFSAPMQFNFGVTTEDIQAIVCYTTSTHFKIDYVRQPGIFPGHQVVGTASGGVSFEIKYYILVEEGS